ncbi:MAG: hypothetical protein J0L94_00475 [Rhodothermia bacterium]|nr:hypothetical protein [Rhodothermia bacterium]
MKNLPQIATYRLGKDQADNVKGGITRKAYSQVTYLKKPKQNNPRRENMRVVLDESNDTV